MSIYAYAGKFVNPTEDFGVGEREDGKFVITVAVRCECGEPCCSQKEVGFRIHTNASLVFESEEEAEEWIDHTADSFEEDYDQYLEENSYEIRRMELYEMYRNEY